MDIKKDFQQRHPRRRIYDTKLKNVNSPIEENLTFIPKITIFMV
jgi:hypothetical protein